MTRTVHWTLEPAARTPGERLRDAVAATLRAASAVLARLAQRLHVSEAVAPAAEPVLEFYAEAGAPEGALYADGRRIGVLEGVTRL